MYEFEKKRWKKEREREGRDDPLIQEEKRRKKDGE